MTTTIPGATTTSAPVPDEMAVLVKQLQAFVEENRGLRFTHDVKVTLLDDAAFRARIRQLTAEDDASIEVFGKLLKALGLMKANVDIKKARDELLGGAVLGFYDPETEELVVRGARITPYVRVTLVHEITHAVQDQNFDIDRPEVDDSTDESSTGFSSVLEGDAVRIQEEYRTTLSKSERRQANAEENNASAGLDPRDIPPVLAQLLVFPYTRGRDFVAAVLSAGGQPRLDAAIKAPPTTSEQILHPERFLAGEGPKQVAAPEADAAAIDKGVLGELGLQLLLANAVSGPTALDAAAGWGGDQYVAWDRGDETCVRVAITMDTAGDMQALRSGLEKWASDQDEASVAGTDPLMLTTCA